MSAASGKHVVVLGKGELAIRICEWFCSDPDHELIAVVPVIPEPAWTASLSDWATQRGIDVVASGHYRDLEAEHIDLGFSCFYDKIIKPDFIARCGRLLNLHNGPLPRYRGVRPINWALKNGELKHGVTIHEITPGIDDGPIVAQAEYTIYPEFDEVEDVYKRALAFGWTLFEQTMSILDRIEAREQDESQATYYDSDSVKLLGDRAGFRRPVSDAQRAEHKPSAGAAAGR